MGGTGYGVGKITSSSPTAMWWGEAVETFCEPSPVENAVYNKNDARSLERLTSQHSERPEMIVSNSTTVIYESNLRVLYAH